MTIRHLGYKILTLMTTGENDTLFKPKFIKEGSCYIPGANMTELPTTAHFP